MGGVIYRKNSCVVFLDVCELEILSRVAIDIVYKTVSGIISGEEVKVPDKGSKEQVGPMGTKDALEKVGSMKHILEFVLTTSW
jgi:hypothetical protein